jgi:predicted PurR-regulated permease PerM
MSNEPTTEHRRSRLATYNQVALAMAATLALCYYGRLVLFPILLGVTVALVLAPLVDRLARFRGFLGHSVRWS